MKRIILAGSSGFIGSHLVKKLMLQGNYVIGVDIEKPSWCIPNEFHQQDLRYVRMPFKNIDEVYCLACLMGGMGYIGDEVAHGYDIAIGSTQIVVNVIQYCNDNNVSKVFYSSSACVYNQDLQKDGDVYLKESDAIPANPDLLYGWQKLFSEKMFQASGLNVRIARFHNIFGEGGAWDNGKEKAPAAICRKVALSNNAIEVWGTGEQKRSFMYIDECLKFVESLMNSDYTEPLNIGSSEIITINDLARMVINISGKDLRIVNVPGNVGVGSRCSDNDKCYEVLGMRPSLELNIGMTALYYWVKSKI